MPPDPWIPDISVPILWKDLSVLSNVLAVRARGYHKVWGSKRRLKGSLASPQVQPVFQRRVRSGAVINAPVVA